MHGSINNKHTKFEGDRVYNVFYPFPEDRELVQIEAIPEFMPHLMTWSPVTMGREGKVSLGRVVRVMAKYLGNMTEEEVNMVAPRIAKISREYEINAIDTYDECAIIHCHINDQPYSCVITVMNLIEDNGHWLRRDTLN